jgi:hypothetical protein
MTPKSDKAKECINEGCVEHHPKTLHCAFHPKQVNSFCELCMIENTTKVRQSTAKEIVEMLEKEADRIADEGSGFRYGENYYRDIIKLIKDKYTPKEAKP